MDAKLLDLLEQIAKAIAAQFGSNCEVVIHELSGKSAYSSIVAIENGHVTGRKVGDGPSHVVLEQLGHEDDGAKDHRLSHKLFYVFSRNSFRSAASCYDCY